MTERLRCGHFVRFAVVRSTKISVHCKNVNMAEPNGYIRDARGKFSMKQKLEWKLNVSTANKRRRIEISEKQESIVNGRRIVEVKLLADEMWCIMVIIMKITGHLKFARELAVERRCQSTGLRVAIYDFCTILVGSVCNILVIWRAENVLLLSKYSQGFILRKYMVCRCLYWPNNIERLHGPSLSRACPFYLK